MNQRPFRASSTSLGALALWLVVAGAGCIDSDAGGPPVRRSEPARNAGMRRASSHGWTVVQAADFNLDGMADVLWNDPDNNLIAIWLMDGTQLLAPGPALPGPVGDGWEAMTSGDLDHDGMADVVWHNAGRNLMTVWLMDGVALRAPGPMLPGPPGEGWIPVRSVGDFNFDSMADVAWNNPRENLATVWLMDGSALLAPGPVLPGPVGDGWNAATVADYNFDGLADLVWNNPGKNLLTLWLMDGTRPLAPGPVLPGPVGDGWRVVPSAGDFNFDGMADVLWNNTAQNALAVWLMNSTELLAPGPPLSGPPGGGWVVPTNGDLNFDGMLDAIWAAENPARMVVWLMHGYSLFLAGPLLPGPHGP